MSIYYPPVYENKQFHCPICHVFAVQEWSNITTINLHQKSHGLFPIKYRNSEIMISICLHCKSPTFWLKEKIIYPPTHPAPQVNSDLPDSVKAVYEEASAIANQSPRAACALLRLAIEMLLKHLGETGSINDTIKQLVANGLDRKIQQSLDIVRVTGNDAVHPGEIRFDDTTDVQALFQLINVIADALITQPKQIQELYDNLPENKKNAIEERDGQTK